MDKRFALFLALALAIYAANVAIVMLLRPPQPAVVAQKNDKGPAEQKPAPPPAAQKPAAVAEAEKPAAEVQPAAKADEAAPVQVKPQWGTLGSGDPASPYRMLVTWTNRGAAVEWIELNSPRYRDLEERKHDIDHYRSGYLGQLAATAAKNGGALVQVVGQGTPAATAGLQPEDVIQTVNGQKIVTADGLEALLSTTKPGQSIELTVLRGQKKLQLSTELGRRPLAVVRPESGSEPLDVVPPVNHDPFSLLLTLAQINDQTLKDPKDADAELAGLDLRSGSWEVVDHNDTQVTFKRALAKHSLELVKRYRLEKVPPSEAGDATAPYYHLVFDVEIHNTGQSAARVAYQLDGPTGLPIEGYWYASKVSLAGGQGLRDVVVRFQGRDALGVGCAEIADDKSQPWVDTPLEYMAVDAQYFAAALIPQKENPTDSWFHEVRPLRVGAVPADKSEKKLTNVSFRLVSQTAKLEPGAALKHQYTFFAGPKKPDLLAKYGPSPPVVSLGDVVYYGWFWYVAKPMLWILHGFYYLVGNYGLAIIMLTVLVRGLMFPLSRKQAIGAQKMQELQPEMKRISEKYKKSPEQRTKALQEMYRKHNYNPLSGCLPALVQLPIFIGLYRSLAVDVELRQSPLLGSAIRWCSNLAAPDMFLNWSSFMPQILASTNGYLGPYLNILPLVTIGLFIWQQKMFMPPAADEQAEMQQKVMKYMMIFMGFLFYKVAAGLCLYFIASSLWGIAERKLLGKMVPKKAGSSGASGAQVAAKQPPPSPPTGNGATRGKRRQPGQK